VIFSYILTLAFVLALAVGSLVVLKQAKLRGLMPRTSGAINIVAQQSVGVGHSMSLVEVDGRRLLIGVSKGGLTLLERFEPVAAARETGGERSDVVAFPITLRRAR